MRRARSANRSVRVERKSHAGTLDARAAEAATLVVRVLARYGCAPKDIEKAVQKACRKVPRSWARNPKAAPPEMYAAGHALSLWFQDPAYLDSSGNPRPLPVRGAAPSLESLVRRVDPTLDVEETLRYLLRPSVLRRVGDQFVPPPDRTLWVRGSGGFFHSQSLRTLIAVLSTLEHNNRPRRSTPGRLDVSVLNQQVPISQVPGFDKRLRQRGMEFVAATDTDLVNCERARVGAERTVSVGVAVVRFEEPAWFSERPPRGPKRHRK